MEEEKRYPILEEEEGMVTACEPMEAVAVSGSQSGVVYVDDELDDLDWSKYPFLGPKTEDEAIARIDKAWEERNDPTKWITSVQMWGQIYEKYPWLR